MSGHEHEHELAIDPDPAPLPGGVDALSLGAVAAGGVVGSLARHAIAEAWPVEPGAFPWATFGANVVGSLLLGLALVVLSEVWPVRPRVRGLLSSGVLGAFTTMSTFLVEVVVLGKDGHAAVAVAYVVTTVAVGLVAAGAGIRLGRLAETARA